MFAYKLIQSLRSSQTSWASSDDQNIDVAMTFGLVMLWGDCRVNAAYMFSPFALVNCLLCPEVAMICNRTCLETGLYCKKHSGESRECVEVVAALARCDSVQKVPPMHVNCEGTLKRHYILA